MDNSKQYLNGNLNGNLQSKSNLNGNINKNMGHIDYNNLYNKPSINDMVLEGNKTLEELNIQEKGDYPEDSVTNIEIDNLFN